MLLFRSHRLQPTRRGQGSSSPWTGLVVWSWGLGLLWLCVPTLLLGEEVSRAPARAGLEPTSERGLETPADPDHLLHQLDQALRLTNPDPVRRYLLLSALVSVGREAARWDALDALLLDRFAPTPEQPLSWLVALWWADNALYARQYEEASRRYRQLLAWLEQDEARAGTPLMLIEAPLSEWVVMQLASAQGLAGQLRAGAALLDPGRAWSDLLRQAARTRGARLAARAGDRTLEDAFKARAPLPPDSGSAPPRKQLPEIRAQEAVGFRAPWEPGKLQRAGQWDRSWARTLSLIARIPFDPQLRACGGWHGGFYYDTGTHADVRTRGRDTFAIDFTAPRGQSNAGGRGSYGLELRAVASGVVGIPHYGTPTHHDLRGIRPLAENNRVTLFHLPAALTTLDALVYRQPRTLRWPGTLATRLMDLWDYSSSYHHLVGLENACEPWRGPGQPRTCLAAPAQVSAGQWVWGGGLLGYQDSTGYAWGPHLHFQINLTCQREGAVCPDPLRQRFTGVSVPMVLEGQALSSGSVGRCIRSTNASPLSLEGHTSGLPRVLEALVFPEGAPVPERSPLPTTPPLSGGLEVKPVPSP